MNICVPRRFFRLPQRHPAHLGHPGRGREGPHHLQRPEPSGPQEVHRRPARVHRRGPGDGEVPHRV